MKNNSTPWIIAALSIGAFLYFKNKNATPGNGDTAETKRQRAELISWLSNGHEDIPIYNFMTPSEISMVWKFKSFERAENFTAADSMWPIIEQIARKYNIAI